MVSNIFCDVQSCYDTLIKGAKVKNPIVLAQKVFLTLTSLNKE